MYSPGSSYAYAALAIMCALLVAADAIACSPPLPVVNRTVEPADGSKDVVRNVQVRVRYTQWGGQDYVSTMSPPKLVDGTGKDGQHKLTKTGSHS